MKIRPLSRSAEQFERPSTADVERTWTNRDKELHTMPRAVEYQRALRATKLERTFAKPLVCAMSDHTGAVTALCRPPASGTQDAAGVATVMSGSSTGEVLLVRLRSPGTRRRSSTGVCLSRLLRRRRA